MGFGGAEALLGYMLVLPKGPPGYLVAWLLYMIGWYVMNGMLASEFVRKRQLEADQIAAQQIQQTLHPQKLKKLPGTWWRHTPKRFVTLVATTLMSSTFRATERCRGRFRQRDAGCSAGAKHTGSG